MRKAILATLLAVTFPTVSLADNHMTGIWQCKMVSEYGDFEFVLLLSDDKTYQNKINFFGNINIDYGKWSMDGDVLVLNREKVVEKGVEKASSQEFRREIVSVSGSALEMKHEGATTNCTKAR